MNIEITRTVEDLSRKTGKPTLGRAGWAVSFNGKLETVCYDDEFSDSRNAAEIIVSAIEERERAQHHFRSLDGGERRRIRLEYSKTDAWDNFPTVCHYAVHLSKQPATV